MKFDTLQPGDEVARMKGGLHLLRFAFERVVRVSKTRVMLESGRRFDFDGYEVKSDLCPRPQFTGQRLWSADDARRVEARQESQRAQNNLVRQTLDKLAGRKNGLGDYSLNTVQLNAVKALLDSLNAPEEGD